jgi:hypothetical protein
MSVIANVLCTPNRLEMLLRAIGAMPGGVARQELIGRLSPAVLREDAGDEGGQGKPMAANVLEEALKLGLVETRDNVLVLADPMILKAGRLAAWLHEHLLSVEFADAIGQRAFPRALAWFLGQDPMHPIPAESAQAMLLDQYGNGADLFELASPQPFQQFAYWARYLGYGTYLPINRVKAVFQPDPTVAVARIVQSSIRDHQAVPIRTFVQRLAEASPVLDGGATRAIVEGQLPADRQADIELGVSRTLSFALACLEEMGQISLVSTADAPSLLLAVGDVRRSVTHVSVAVGVHRA